MQILYPDTVAKNSGKNVNKIDAIPALIMGLHSRVEHKIDRQNYFILLRSMKEAKKEWDSKNEHGTLH